MEKTRFWSRVGDWFKHSHRSVALVEALSYAPEAPHTAVDGNGHAVTDRFTESAVAIRSPKRPVEARGPEDRYAKIEALVDSLQEHFVVQDTRSEKIAASLERLAVSLAHLPEVSKAQLDILATIRDGLEAHAVRGKRLDESLAQLPQLADAQRETMASIGRQLDLSRQTSEQVSTVLDRFQQAVSGLGDATTASASALRQLHADSSAKEERMIHVLEQQTKRFTFFACVAIGAALVAALIGLAAAWWS